jgi:inward rectifier potassium channel
LSRSKIEHPTPQSHSQEVVKIGTAWRPLHDLYLFLLTSRWSTLFGLMFVGYVGANAIFAVFYLVGGGVENAEPGSFRDAYFFSVQTMATIGYGKMVPVSTFANLLVSIEAAFGLVLFALATGLMFAKFSQPRARVLFSKFCIVSMRDGKPSLMVRIANERATGLVEAQIRLVLVRDETTVEGEAIRRFHTLPLSRSSSAVFALSWTVIHAIDESSPLHGETSESLGKARTDIVASLIGIEEATGQTVHARHSWKGQEIRFQHRFVDILVRTPQGQPALDYTRFHDVERID